MDASDGGEDSGAGTPAIESKLRLLGFGFLRQFRAPLGRFAIVALARLGGVPGFVEIDKMVDGFAASIRVTSLRCLLRIQTVAPGSLQQLMSMDHLPTYQDENLLPRQPLDRSQCLSLRPVASPLRTVRSLRRRVAIVHSDTMADLRSSALRGA